MGRLYRAGLSGRVDTAEAARLAFILKEVRAALESEADSRVLDMPADGGFGPVSIYAIPRACFLFAEQIADPDNLLEQAVLTAPFEPTPELSALPPAGGRHHARACRLRGRLRRH